MKELSLELQNLLYDNNIDFTFLNSNAEPSSAILKYIESNNNLIER